MQHYFSDAFAFSTSASPASLTNVDSLHVGSGFPNFLPLFIRKDEDESLHSCSSVCSAASTVASAVCSIGDSISFPVSSETTFDLTTRLNFEFSSEKEHAPARKRTCNSNRGWKRSAYDSERECRTDSSSLLDFIAQNRGLESSCKQGNPGSAGSALPICKPATECALEEFSLGSGSPFASGDLISSKSFK
mmetsp:Transcript_39256/g.82203  ORF Transcript_39256/g.82203 Transcript_39256/m.82203 type:complete len:191 (-) Transcript_39256:240-812(-)